jgi:trehalose-phosphatase
MSDQSLDPRLGEALARLASVDQLLVGSDYDGVLAPIVTDPALARPLPAALDALRELSKLPRTTVALVSGRVRQQLAELAPLPPQVHLVGSHGSEFDDRARLTPAQATLRQRLADVVHQLVADLPGVRVEHKPASVAVHTRTAEPQIATRAQRAVVEGPAQWPGVHPLQGKEVVELTVSPSNKGTAVAILRDEHAADAVLFLGDDVTDEYAFEVLGEQDVGVKVGPGDTRARYRVPDPQAVVEVLSTLVRLRREATSG